LDIFTTMTSVQAAAFNIGLLTILMFAIKIYVANRRGFHKVPSGETTPAFSRATRVQLNAVEDVPVLMAGIAGLAMLGMPAWYIHMAGLVLLVARIAHAVGLASSSGFSWGRAVGTMGTMLVYLAVGGALLVHAFAP
jgi:uncharacterized membrane protein YecN with MAPEG domain